MRDTAGNSAPGQMQDAGICGVGVSAWRCSRVSIEGQVAHDCAAAAADIDMRQGDRRRLRRELAKNDAPEYAERAPSRDSLNFAGTPST